MYVCLSVSDPPSSSKSAPHWSGYLQVSSSLVSDKSTLLSSAHPLPPKYWDNVPKLLGQKPLRYLVNVWQNVSFLYIFIRVVNVLQKKLLAHVHDQFEVVIKFCYGGGVGQQQHSS